MALGQSSRLRRPENITRSIPRMLAAQGPSISFEFFPPKDDASEAVLWEAIRRLERVQPSFVSVTYGAGGTTQDRTVRVTERIARETTLTPLAHLTCVNASVAQLRQVVGQYAAAGVRSILALRGRPAGQRAGRVGGPPRGPRPRRGPRQAGARPGRLHRRRRGLPGRPPRVAEPGPRRRGARAQARRRRLVRDHPDGLRRRLLPAPARQRWRPGATCRSRPA